MTYFLPNWPCMYGIYFLFLYNSTYDLNCSSFGKLCDHVTRLCGQFNNELCFLLTLEFWSGEGTWVVMQFSLHLLYILEMNDVWIHGHIWFAYVGKWW